MSRFYNNGHALALTTLGLNKAAGSRVPVSHSTNSSADSGNEEDASVSNQTHRRQALSQIDLAKAGPGVDSVWDRHDDLIQNPAVASEHVRFVGE